jgi:ribosomal-protein-alanine N-acetyltransferase
MAASVVSARVAPTLRRATPAHADAIAELARGSLPEAWSERAFAAELRREGALAWVLEAEGRVVGYLLAARAADEAELLSMAVDADRRRAGLGRRLLEGCLAALRADGVRRLTLEVRAGNAAARALYAGCGLAVVGERRRYYRDGEDAVLYGVET